jgi:hypothetical protein
MLYAPQRLGGSAVNVAIGQVAVQMGPQQVCTPSKKVITFPWESLSASSAALSGIIVWALPIGLMFAVDEFLRSKNWAALVPMVNWPLAGAAFGLLMP